MNTETQNLTWGRRFHRTRIAFLQAKNPIGLANSYAENAVLVSFGAVVRGRDALERHFENYLQTAGELEIISIDNFAETEDAVFWEASVIMNGEKHRVYDAFTFENGEIVRHFTGAMDRRD